MYFDWGDICLGGHTTDFVNEKPEIRQLKKKKLVTTSLSDKYHIQQDFAENFRI